MAVRPPPERAETSPSDRTMIGVASLLCGVLALAAQLFLTSNTAAPVAGAAVRVGLLMGALWLAMPRNGRVLQGKILATLVVACLIVAAFRGRIVFYLLPILLAMGIVAVLIRPRNRKK